MTIRQRYCNTRATSLEDILTTCERHLHNTTLMHLDFIDNEDITPTDEFYIKMLFGMWGDLREDVQNILQKD